MAFLYLILGFLIGSIIIYLVLAPQLKNAKKENQKLLVKINMLQSETEKTKQDLAQQTEMQKKWERRFYQLQYTSQNEQKDSTPDNTINFDVNN